MSRSDSTDEVDLDLVIAEVYAEAERIRRTRAGREQEAALDAAFRRHAPAGIEGGDTKAALAELERLSNVSLTVPGGLAPGSPLWKRAIVKAVRAVLGSRPVGRAVGLLTKDALEFNRAIVRALVRNDDRLRRLERLLGATSTRLQVELDHLPEPTMSDDLVAAVVDAVGSPPGRVLHLGCGRGELVRRLTELGRSAYGVDERRSLHVDALRSGLDVRADDPAAHLTALPDGAVGAIVLGGPIRQLGTEGLIELLDDALRVVGAGGTIVVLLGSRSDPDGIAADLLARPQLGPAAWAHLLRVRTDGEPTTIEVDGAPAAIVARTVA